MSRKSLMKQRPSFFLKDRKQTNFIKGKIGIYKTGDELSPSRQGNYKKGSQLAKICKRLQLQKSLWRVHQVGKSLIWSQKISYHHFGNDANESSLVVELMPFWRRFWSFIV